MGHDPAFLFYYKDYTYDTCNLSDKAHVFYDTVMCRHYKNDKNKFEYVNEEYFNLLLESKKINETDKQSILSVIKKNENGFYIPWVKNSIEKRISYCDSRRENIKKRYKKESTYVEHTNYINNTPDVHSNYTSNSNRNSNRNSNNSVNKNAVNSSKKESSEDSNTTVVDTSTESSLGHTTVVDTSNQKYNPDDNITTLYKNELVTLTGGKIIDKIRSLMRCQGSFSFNDQKLIISFTRKYPDYPLLDSIDYEIKLAKKQNRSPRNISTLLKDPLDPEFIKGWIDNKISKNY